MLHRMSPPQNPLPRPPGHPPRPFAGPSRGAGASHGSAGNGEGGMGALLGVASQLRPPRVSFRQTSGRVCDCAGIINSVHHPLLLPPSLSTSATLTHASLMVPS